MAQSALLQLYHVARNWQALSSADQLFVGLLVVAEVNGHVRAIAEGLVL